MSFLSPILFERVGAITVRCSPLEPFLLSSILGSYSERKVGSEALEFSGRQILQSRETSLCSAGAVFGFLVSPCLWEESGDLQCEISVMSAFVSQSPVSFAVALCRLADAFDCR